MTDSPPAGARDGGLLDRSATPEEAHVERALPGIGPQKAKNIVAQLQGKVAKFALAREGAPAEPVTGKPAAPDAEGLREMVWEILVKQLGHRPSEASQLITDALRRRPEIFTPEALFDEIYRGQAPPAVRERG